MTDDITRLNGKYFQYILLFWGIHSVLILQYILFGRILSVFGENISANTGSVSLLNNLRQRETRV